jgi:hypothetical protein
VNQQKQAGRGGRETVIYQGKDTVIYQGAEQFWQTFLKLFLCSSERSRSFSFAIAAATKRVMLGVHLFFSIFVHLAHVAFFYYFFKEFPFVFVGSIFVHIYKMDKDGEKKMDNKHYSFCGFLRFSLYLRKEEIIGKLL